MCQSARREVGFQVNGASTDLIQKQAANTEKRGCCATEKYNRKSIKANSQTDLEQTEVTMVNGLS